MPKSRTDSRQRRRAVLISPQPVDQYPPVRNQARILNASGYDVILFTSKRPGSQKINFHHEDIRVRTFSVSSSNRLIRLIGYTCFVVALWWMYLREIELEIDYDPIGICFGTWVRRLAPRRAKVLVHHHHEVLFPDTRSPFDKPARLALPQADLVVVADEDRARLMRQAEPNPRLVLTVKNVPMRTSVLLGEPKPDTKFSVGYFGSMGTSQALDSVVQSMPFWPENVCLHLYGEPSTGQRSEIEALASDLGVESKVLFEGWVEPSKLLKKVSRHQLVFTLLRPLNENWRFSAGASNKRFQAMAAGVAQVSDNAPGVVDLVEKNGVGVCVSPEHPNEIADAVRMYSNDRTRASTEGAKAQELIKTKFNYEAEFKKVLNFAEQLLELR